MAHSYDGSAINSTDLARSRLMTKVRIGTSDGSPRPLRAYFPHAANASLNARSPGAPFSIAMMARRWLA